MNTGKMVWTEGMLLQPQHFQQSERYHEHQMNMRTARLPCSHGFFHLTLEVDKTGLRKIWLKAAAGIFPDGSYFELDPTQDPIAVEIPLGVTDQPVYLALPLAVGNHMEVRARDKPEILARYIGYRTELVDSNDAQRPPCAATIAAPDLRLILGTVAQSAIFVQLQVAHVQGIGVDGRLAVDSAFSPSFLHLRASGPLLRKVEELLGPIAERAGSIADRMRSVGQMGSAYLEDVLILQLLNRAEAQLKHLLGVANVHPREFFEVLLALFADISTFSAERRPPKAIEYDHDNQALAFAQLDRQIRQMLLSVNEQHAQLLHLQPREHGILVASLNDHTFLDDGYFVLVAQADCDSDSVRARLPQQLKVGTLETLGDLIDRHLPGVALKPVTAPRQLPFNNSHSYFQLKPDEQEMVRFRASGAVALHLAGEFPGLVLKLWAVRD